MLFIYKNIRRFYRSFIASTSACVLYTLGIQKGNQIPVNTIKENSIYSSINYYIDLILDFIKSIPIIVYNLTHLNYNFLIVMYYMIVILAILSFTY